MTDPGSPLDGEARAAGYSVVNADPDVGGRYSALTAFGLVPSGLAGADIGGLLDDAASIEGALQADDADNPGLRLGALAGLAAVGGVDKLILADAGSGISGFGDWAEQLIAESTGKLGKGVLPVVVEGVDAPNFQPSTADSVLVTLGSGTTTRPPDERLQAAVSGSLGAQMLLWEYAVAVAGRVIGINPFDQPDVESAKAAARGLLDSSSAPDPADFTDGGIEVRATPGLLDGAGSPSTRSRAPWRPAGALDDQHGYLAVMAYLDRLTDASLAGVRTPLAPADRASGDFRLGAALPALDRAVPQGRPADGGLPADHRQRPTPTWRCRDGRSPSAASSPRRRPATPRSWPGTAARSCGCT